MSFAQDNVKHICSYPSNCRFTPLSYNRTLLSGGRGSAYNRSPLARRLRYQKHWTPTRS